VETHYREAQRAKSDADFIHKMEGGLQELEETQYWFELLAGAEIVKRDQLDAITQECDELISIFVSIVTHVKSRRS
jgi:four helix bundle protein